jgi:hypothetical protein
MAPKPVTTTCPFTLYVLLSRHRGDDVTHPPAYDLSFLSASTITHLPPGTPM